MIESANHSIAAINEALDHSAEVIEKIFSAAQPGAVFGQPVVSGSYTVITASEIAAGGGFGYGKGFGPARPIHRPETPEAEGTSSPAPEQIAGGGGGGGGSHGRPVAVIVIGPDGVQVKPVVDATKLAIASLAVFGAMVAVLRRIGRASR